MLRMACVRWVARLKRRPLERRRDAASQPAAVHGRIEIAVGANADDPAGIQKAVTGECTTFVVSASTKAGVRTAVAILCAAIISSSPATAAEPSPSTAAEMLVYSQWAKFCGKGQDPNAKEVCFTGKDGRTEAGQPVVAAALIEPSGEPKKWLIRLGSQGRPAVT